MNRIQGIAAKRDMWIALGYVPALVVTAGPVFFALRAGLEWLLRRLGLPLAGRLMGLDGLSDLTAVPLVLVATWLYLRLVKAGGPADLGLRRGRLAPLSLLAGLAIAAGALGLILAVDVLRGALVIHGLNPLVPWAVLAAVGAATRAGWAEEIVCRGVLLQFLERGLNRPLAITLSTALFVVAHLPPAPPEGLVRWLALTLAGLTFAAAYYVAGRNLWLAIGLHWGVDLWIMILFGPSRVSSTLVRWQLLEPYAYGLAGYMNRLMIVALPLCCLALAAWYLIRRRAAGRTSSTAPRPAPQPHIG